MVDHVGNEGELALVAAIIIRGHIVRVIESQFGTNGDELVRPISDAD